MKIAVSACLLGKNCKYNGGNNLCPAVCKFVEGHTVIPVCPEEQAGLGIPRTPVEIVNGCVQTKDGVSVDAPLRDAVSQILAQLLQQEVTCAVLKSRSPTCGVHQVYDGTFSGTLRDGAGVLAQALMDAGIRVLDSEDVEGEI